MPPPLVMPGADFDLFNRPGEPAPQQPAPQQPAARAPEPAFPAPAPQVPIPPMPLDAAPGARRSDGLGDGAGDTSYLPRTSFGETSSAPSALPRRRPPPSGLSELTPPPGYQRPEDLGHSAPAELPPVSPSPQLPTPQLITPPLATPQLPAPGTTPAGLPQRLRSRVRGDVPAEHFGRLDLGNAGDSADPGDDPSLSPPTNALRELQDPPPVSFAEVLNPSGSIGPLGGYTPPDRSARSDPRNGQHNRPELTPFPERPARPDQSRSHQPASPDQPDRSGRPGRSDRSRRGSSAGSGARAAVAATNAAASAASAAAGAAGSAASVAAAGSAAQSAAQGAAAGVAASAAGAGAAAVLGSVAAAGGRASGRSTNNEPDGTTMLPVTRRRRNSADGASKEASRDKPAKDKPGKGWGWGKKARDVPADVPTQMLERTPAAAPVPESLDDATRRIARVPAVDGRPHLPEQNPFEQNLPDQNLPEQNQPEQNQPDQNQPEQNSPEQPLPPEQPHGRAGRNLPAAIAVGVLLAGLALASLFTRPEAFVALVSLVVVLAVWELAGAMATKQIIVPVIPLAVGSVGMLVSAYVAGEEGLLISFALTGVGVLLWRIIEGVGGAARDVTAGIFTAAYVPLLAGFAILLLADPHGPVRVVTFILVTVSSDIGGYVAGVLAGKHPMAPTISPKKSWEGFAGSVITCLISGTVCVMFLLDGRAWVGLALGAVTALTATIGDLSESLIKRDLGVKDMGSLLPGHGGIMDRLDSLLPTAPVAFLILHYLVT